MAKQQQFIDLFTKNDEDKDGEINQEEFITIITKLEVPYQYPGSVTKIIRKLNYANPDKETLNLQQAKEYYNSFESTSKHEIWKAKIGLLNKVEELKKAFSQQKEESSAAPPAAPGAVSFNQQSEKKPQEAHLNILIGQHQPVYLSEIDVQIQKIETTQKVKPFVKLTITSKTEERAKQVEILFKQNVNSFLGILSQEEPDYADLVNEIHVNSMVNQTKAIFFITTTNEQVSQYIQLLGQFFDLSFSTQLTGKVHLRYEFDYDFEKFINEENSNFYDLFTRNCRLSIDVKLLNLLKSLKKYLKVEAKQNPYMEIGQTWLVTALFHIENIEGDFEFQNAQSSDYDLQSKEQIKELLRDWGQFFDSLSSSGMKVRELLSYLDETVTVQVNGGHWKGNAFLRLKNFQKVLLKLAKPAEEQPSSSQNPPIVGLAHQTKVLNKSDSDSSISSLKKNKTSQQKPVLMKNASVQKIKAPKQDPAQGHNSELSEDSDQ